MNRHDRRSITERYRAVNVDRVCEVCEATLRASFIVERGDPTPSVTFLHLIGGGHEPIIAGSGIAARSRRDNAIVSTTRKVLDS